MLCRISSYTFGFYPSSESLYNVTKNGNLAQSLNAMTAMPIIVQSSTSAKAAPHLPPSSRSSLLGFLRPILAPTRRSISHTTQIHRPPNQMISHTRTILTPATPHQHHTMLLHIMSFPGNIRRNHSPRAQPHSCHFSFCGIGLLGFRRADFEAHAFKFWG